MITAYCTQVIAVPHPSLVPVLTVWHNKPGKHPVTAAKQAIERIGGPCERFALMDQPPGGGIPFHSYSTEFGALFDERGLLEGSHRLREWMVQAFEECKHQGMSDAPELLTLDHEALPTEGIKWGDRQSVYERAAIRAACARYCVLEPAQIVWGRTLPACNYEDRKGLVGDVDPNGHEYAAVGVSDLVCPVWYEEPVRPLRLDTVKARAAMTVARAADLGREVVPWINTAAVAEWWFRVLGGRRCVLWGSGKAPSFDAQEWVSMWGDE